jgi:hypothetical protein
MTPLALLTELCSRGAELVTDGTRLGVRPAGVLTDDDRRALQTYKAEVLALIRAEPEGPVPLGPCGLCGRPLAWVDDWPTAGEVRWLCPRCASFPASTLAAVFAQLTPKERDRLEAEGAQDDALARAVLGELRAEGRRVMGRDA